jgi:Mor family transcriptional regulator
MTGLIHEMRRVVAGVVGDDQKAKDVVFALISNFGGERLTMPTNDFEGRNKEIKDLHGSGATVTQLAKRYRLSVRTVYRIIG